MTILKHMCPKCGHSDESHRTDDDGTGLDCSYRWCPCTNTSYEPEPTVCPTWDPDQRPVLTVTPPGTRWPDVGAGLRHLLLRCLSHQVRRAGQGVRMSVVGEGVGPVHFPAERRPQDRRACVLTHPVAP